MKFGSPCYLWVTVSGGKKMLRNLSPLKKNITHYIKCTSADWHTFMRQSGGCTSPREERISPLAGTRVLEAMWHGWRLLLPRLLWLPLEEKNEIPVKSGVKGWCRWSPSSANKKLNTLLYQYKWLIKLLQFFHSFKFHVNAALILILTSYREVSGDHSS